MTQPAIAIAPPAAEAGEPTMEELVALVPELPPEPAEELVEVAAEGGEAPEGDAATAPETPADPATAVEPTEADAALERATKAAERARAGSRRYAETQRMLADQAHAHRQAAQEAEQLRRETAQMRQREQALKQDPYKALKDLGMTDQQLAERAMRENSPEAATLRLAEELKEERAARMALEQRLVNEQREAAARTAAREAEAHFAQVADNEAAFPRLAQLSTEVQLTVARAALERIKANGYDVTRLSNEQIAEASEAYLAPKRPAKAVVAPAVITPKPLAKTSGATLTNKAAQTRTVAPATWDSLTEEQQLAHIAAGLPEPGA